MNEWVVYYRCFTCIWQHLLKSKNLLASDISTKLSKDWIPEEHPAKLRGFPCHSPSLIVVLILKGCRCWKGCRINACESSSFITYPLVTKVFQVCGSVFQSSASCTVLYSSSGLCCRGAFNQWDEMNCTRIARTECSFPLSLNERLWTFVLRVRSELGQMTSDWVEADPFVAERDSKWHLWFQ